MTQHITHTPEHTHVVHRPSSLAHIVYSILDILEILLALRLVFRLFGANTGNLLVQLLYEITRPFVAPFVGIFSAPQGVFFEWGTVIAMLAYTILAYLIVRIFDLE